MIRKKYKKLDYNTEDLEPLSNSDLKKVADYWLRQYLIETAEKRNGKFYCPLKKQWLPEDKIHVCHYFDRSIMHLRYSLDNCHLISSISNTFDAQIQEEGYKSKHHKEYEEFLRKKIGEKKFENLLRMSSELTIFAKEDYIKVINKFKNGN